MPDTKIRAGSTAGELVQVAEGVYRDLPVTERSVIDEAIMNVQARTEMYGTRGIGVVSAFELTTRLGIWLARGGDKMIGIKESEV